MASVLCENNGNECHNLFGILEFGIAKKPHVKTQIDPKLQNYIFKHCELHCCTIKWKIVERKHIEIVENDMRKLFSEVGVLSLERRKWPVLKISKSRLAVIRNKTRAPASSQKLGGNTR